MTIAITPLSTPMPSQNDPENFSDRMDVFLSELPAVVTQSNAQNAENNGLSADVTAKHTAVLNTYTTAMAAGLGDAAANASTATTKADEAATSAGLAAAAWTAALAANPDLNPVIRMNPSVITENITIPSHYNAYSAGPLQIADGATVTINDHANWSIL